LDKELREDVITDFGELLLDFLAIFAGLLEVIFLSTALLLLFNGSNDSERSTARTNDIFVSDRQKISFLD